MATLVSLVARAIEILAVCFTEKNLESLHHEIEFLSSELKQMQSFLRDAVEQEVQSEEVRNWLYCVHDVAYEADDVIDEMMLWSSSWENRSVIDLLLDSFWPINGLRQKFKLARKIENLTSRIKDLNRVFEVDGICKASLRRGVESNMLVVKTDLWQSASPVFENFVIGMEEEKEKLVTLLMAEEKADKNLGFICMLGIGGIGKTTLAKRVFEDCHVRRHFECFVWVTIGQNLRIRNILEPMLLQLSEAETRKELMILSDLELAQEIFEFLQTKKCLVVLDDVSRDAWECLRITFPTEEMSSRVLVTTRFKEVGELIKAKKGIIHQMRCLTEVEGWELLRKTAFRGDSQDSEVHQELLGIGKDIVRSCRGLPLAVTVLGGLLVAKPTLHEWKMVHESIDWYQSLDKSSQEFTGMMHQNVGLYSHKDKGSQEAIQMSPILALAYDALPHHLKPCFLYLGTFPGGAEIEAERLYLLWLAEGMIPSTDRESKVTMMDIAEGHLCELAARSMVSVQEEEVPTTRRFKSLHLHDMLRDLCLSKWKDENFFDVICFRRANHLGLGSYSPFSTVKLSRLALYFEDGCVVPLNWNKRKHLWSPSFNNTCQYQQEFMSPPGFSELRDLTKLRALYLRGFNFEILRLRSLTGKLRPLLFLNLRNLPETLSDLREFRRLRVLDISGFNLDVTRLPVGIEKLSRLRFLSLSNCNIKQLPVSICSLFNLETLYLQECPGMIIPNELQRLRRLRYLHLPRSFQVQGLEKLRVDGLRELETLVNFDSSVCKVKDLLKLTKLRKLVAMIGNNSEDLEEIIDCININLNYLRQSSLVLRKFDHSLREKQFIMCKLFECLNLHSLHIEGHLGKLPQNISGSLTKMFFSGCELVEDPMEKLEKLPNLWVLVLRNNAFLGKHMHCSRLGMPQLKHLTLANLQNLENLTVKEGAMPKLSTLVIENCPTLAELPKGLSSLTSLQALMVSWMPPVFVDRLHEGGEDFFKVKHVPGITIKRQ